MLAGLPAGGNRVGRFSRFKPLLAALSCKFGLKLDVRAWFIRVISMSMIATVNSRSAKEKREPEATMFPREATIAPPS